MKTNSSDLLNIVFSINFFGENTGWDGKSNHSEIGLQFMKVNNVAFNPGQNITEEKKELDLFPNKKWLKFLADFDN